MFPILNPPREEKLFSTGRHLLPIHCFFFSLSISFSVNTEQLFFAPQYLFKKTHYIYKCHFKRLCCVGTSNCFVCNHYFFLNIFCFCSKLFPYFSMRSWQYENGAISYSYFCYYNKLFTYE